MIPQMTTHRPGAEDALKIPSLTNGKQVPYVRPIPMGCKPAQPVGFPK